MRLKQLGATLALALICTLAYAKEGYRITLIDKSADSAVEASVEQQKVCAVLYLENWEERIAIDSTFASKRGVYRFSGKENLVPGEYTIELGKHNLEFFISDESYTKEEFTIVPSGSGMESKTGEGNGRFRIIHNSGSRENMLFTSFQNLVNYQWREIGNPATVEKRMDSITTQVIERCSNTLFAQMVDGYSSQPDYLSIFSDKRITSTRFGKKFLKDYFESIEYNHTDSVIAGVERIIEAAPAATRPYLAAEAFHYFEKPSVMGQENVAYHIANEYFNGEEAVYPYEGLDFQIRTFIMLNGKSLIGMEASELQMQDTSSSAVSLKELVDQGEYTILYFYTDDCITCRIETPKLVDFVNNYKYGVINVFAVYTQDYIGRWKRYINDNFNIYNPFVNWINAADPQFESGFHMLYNVISTPQIYLIDNQGTIIGRDLSVKALEELIGRLEEKQQELQLFFQAIFAGCNTVEQAISAIDRIAAGCRNNNELFKEIVSELYTYLKYSQKWNLIEGALYLAQNEIISKPEIWSAGYIERIYGDVAQMSKNIPGEIASQIRLEDTDGNIYGYDSFDGEYNVICFYNTGCNSCLPDVEKLNSIQKEFEGKGIEFISADICKKRENWTNFIVNNQLEWVNLWAGKEEMHKKFDLGTLPSIYLLDKEGMVIARNLSPDTLKELLGKL